MNSSKTVKRKRKKDKAKKPRPSKRSLIDLMSLSVSELNQPLDEARFLTHSKVMDGAFQLIKDQAEVSEHGTYSYLMPGDKRMLFVPQDDPNGGKSKEWMARRKALFWTASKPAGSFFGVYYFHADVARAVRAHRRYNAQASSAQTDLVRPPEYEALEAHSPLFNSLVSFKEVDEDFTAYSLFKMRNGTENEDVAIQEFLKKFTNVFAAEEYLHIFNESTSKNGWSAGTSPDGLLLWYMDGQLARKTSLEVKCGSSCTNQACKRRRQQLALRAGKTTEDEGFYCKDKSHFKVHSSIKTYYVGQMMLEMLGQNLSENTYVSLGYTTRGQPKINAFRMKFSRPALLACAHYMRSLAELKDLAFEVKDNEVYGFGVNSPSFADLNEDMIQLALFMESLQEHEDYDELLGRVHHNFETMKRFSEHAITGAHGWTDYSKRWKELSAPVKKVLANAVKLDPSDYNSFEPLPSLDSVHQDLADTWTDPNIKHAPVNFENPDTSFLQPMTPQRFRQSYDLFLALVELTEEQLSAKDYLAFRVPQGVLSDEFRFCVNFPNPLMMQGDVEKARWLLTAAVDDAFVELRLSEQNSYTAHVVRSRFRRRDAYPSAYNSADSDADSDNADSDFEYESLDEASAFALATLERLESDAGVPAQEWLVEWTPERRADVLGHAARLMGWDRILVLPEDLDEYDGMPSISRPFVDTPSDGFDSIFVPPANYRTQPSWSFSRYVFHKSTNWSPTCMAAPPRIGSYDDQGNVDMNENGALDGKVPRSIDLIRRGARVKVVVCQVFTSTANFHTILVHEDDW